MSNDEYMTRKEVATRLDVSERTVDRWIKSGKLKAIVIGDKLVRVLTSSFKEFTYENI